MPPSKSQREMASRDPMMGRILAWSRVNVTKCEAEVAANRLTIFGPIGNFGDWIDNWVDDGMVLEALDQLHPSDDLEVVINSPGGDAWVGVSIYNLLKAAPNRIQVKIVGMAASAASVVAMAGDSVTMQVGAQLMIHRAWTCLCGNAIELEERAQALRKLDSGLVDIYHARTGMDRAKLEGMLHPDTYMTAAEAIKLGFADAESTEKPEPAVIAAMAKRSPVSSLFFGHR